MSSTRTAVLSLYHKMLRASHGFKDYNFREYAVRRTREEFRKARGENSPEQIAALLRQGGEELKRIQRQALINSLYSTGGDFISLAGSASSASPASSSSSSSSP